MEINNNTSAEFEKLQQQLRYRWKSIDTFDREDYDILVVPSFSIDQEVGQKVTGFLHYEERLLFSLIRLRNPSTRLIYITALPLSPIIIDYYLQLLPGIPFYHARQRLMLLNTEDASLKPLTKKILERPRLVERIRRALRPEKSYMVCFNSTALEEELSVKLGIPLLASSPKLLYWGSKSGSRELFTQCNIPLPEGSLNITSIQELVEASAKLWNSQPQLNKIVVKLNEGFSGEGNAILDLTPIQDVKPGNGSHSQRINALSKMMENLRFQGEGETWHSFSRRIPELGAIVEAFIEGKEKRSPSVQGYITPNGNVEILSTHDQILGGPDNQIYLGCHFPADDEYRLRLQELGIRVGEALAAKGALERYGVDFITVRNPDTNDWDIYAIEINLRKGGTTHPFMTLKFLTNGKYDYNTGLFFSEPKRAKYYIATDNLQKEIYKGLLPHDLMELIVKHRLHFDSSTKTGSLFHLMGALSEFGKLGVTCIGDSREEAQCLYHRVEELLNIESQSFLNSDNTNHLSNPINWTL